ncbi:MAG: hypothetical protein IPN32_25815 [Deltaproteobacteria bacterium]|nr:hypothetical protein [Deltaproteobacteria bacterium]
MSSASTPSRKFDCSEVTDESWSTLTITLLLASRASGCVTVMRASMSRGTHTASSMST